MIKVVYGLLGVSVLCFVTGFVLLLNDISTADLGGKLVLTGVIAWIVGKIVIVFKMEDTDSDENTQRN